LAIDPNTGKLWGTENGDKVYDEIQDGEGKIYRLTSDG